MDEAINRFIKHTVVNLEAALEKDDAKLTMAVLTNLSNTIDSYVEASYMDVMSSALNEATKDFDIK
jgi:hypothetical protein